jgi:hypothetical protein
MLFCETLHGKHINALYKFRPGNKTTALKFHALNINASLYVGVLISS